jgi:hypothetical protein
VDEVARRYLLQALEARPDITLTELQKVLAERRGIHLCVAQVCSVLKRMSVRLKKFTSRPGTLRANTGATPAPFQIL